MAKSIARVKIYKDRIDDFIKAVEKVSVPTRQENGCEFYELYQLDNDETVFYFAEEWKNEDDLKQHLGSAHVAQMIKDLDGVVEEEVAPVFWHKVV